MDPSDKPSSAPSDPGAGSSRRGFLARLSGVAMGLGLVAGYGNFARLAMRYLYPAGDPARQWMFLARADELAPGAAMMYRAPNGETINIARQGEAGGVEDFVALSSVCPHLGCQVHWQAQNDRFFCPCHNGVFDPSGVATEGPPAEAGQSLPRYPLELRSGLLYIQVPTERLAEDSSAERGGRRS